MTDRLWNELDIVVWLGEYPEIAALLLNWDVPN